ncbi:MAG TPA: hypothetical protein VMM57_03415 [Bacteroidota bacterium]|nr:hypothetical protein [Bacteroidota bacterium]
MGQQQLILVLLGIMIIGVGIAAGLGLFSTNNSNNNKMAIMQDLNNIAAHAIKYQVRPATMGGGNGSFDGFTIAPNMVSNANASYSTTSISSNSITVLAVSAIDSSNTIIVTIDSKGHLSGWTYTGDFQ